MVGMRSRTGASPFLAHRGDTSSDKSDCTEFVAVTYIAQPSQARLDLARAAIHGLSAPYLALRNRNEHLEVVSFRVKESDDLRAPAFDAGCDNMLETRRSAASIKSNCLR